MSNINTNQVTKNSDCCQRKSIPKYFANEIQQFCISKKFQHYFSKMIKNYQRNQNQLFIDSINDSMHKRHQFQISMYVRVMFLTFCMLFPLKRLPKIPVSYFSYKFLAYWMVPEVVNPFYSSDYFLYNMDEQNLRHFWRIVQ